MKGEATEMADEDIPMKVNPPSLKNPTWDYLHSNFKKTELQNHWRELGLRKVWVTKETLIDMIMAKHNSHRNDRNISKLLEKIILNIELSKEQLQQKDMEIQNLNSMMKSVNVIINKQSDRISALEEQVRSGYGNNSWDNRGSALDSHHLKDRTLLLGDPNLSDMMSTDLGDNCSIRTIKGANIDLLNCSVSEKLTWTLAQLHDMMDDVAPDKIKDSGHEDHVVVDLRSDTITRPSKGMKEAMMAAPLGDDVFQEDPTVIALESKVAQLLGKEAALFVPTGTMGNLICVMNHCRSRGSEVLLGHLSHIHIYEQGGVAQLGGVHPRTVRNLPDGTFNLDELRRSVRKDDVHLPVTELVCIENTHNVAGGKALPLKWLDELGATCKDLGLPLHMDGARLLNAAAAMQMPPSTLVKHCDSVCICLSKGLGAPVGSVVASTKDFISKARRLRKALGGGMRQAGILAAAGIYALDHVVPTLPRDHAYAKDIAKAVATTGSNAVTVDLTGVHSNILLLECNPQVLTPSQLSTRMGQCTEEETAAIGQSIVARMLPMTDTAVRIVIHCDVTDDDVPLVIKKLKYVIKEFDNLKM